MRSRIDSQKVAPVWTEENTAGLKITKVLNGQDRLNEDHNIGVSDTTFKVLVAETGGNLFVMEHNNQKKGGPARHFHYNEEEYFYVIEGRYIVEVGTERFELGPGDSLLAPRKVPHEWAVVGERGRLIISIAPANKMGVFPAFNANTRTAPLCRPKRQAASRTSATAWNRNHRATAHDPKLIVSDCTISRPR